MIPQDNTLYCDDSLQLIKQFDNDCVDIVVTSPPYNVGHNKKYLSTNDNLTDDEYYEFIKNIITELLRITKHYIFFNFLSMANNKKVYNRVLRDFTEQIEETFIWAKPNPQSVTYGVNRGFEYILCLSKKDIKNFEYRNFSQKHYISNVITKSSNLTNEFQKYHEATFPEWLPEFFIKYFSKTNDLVLDCFNGTGSTSVACKKLNRRYIGIDKEQEYIEITKERIAKIKIHKNTTMYKILTIINTIKEHWRGKEKPKFGIDIIYLIKELKKVEGIQINRSTIYEILKLLEKIKLIDIIYKERIYKENKTQQPNKIFYKGKRKDIVWNKKTNSISVQKLDDILHNDELLKPKYKAIRKEFLKILRILQHNKDYQY